MNGHSVVKRCENEAISAREAREFLLTAVGDGDTV
jgi:hypothetical protein